MEDKEDIGVLIAMTATLTSLIGWLKGKGLWEEARTTLGIDETWKDIAKPSKREEPTK